MKNGLKWSITGVTALTLLLLLVFERYSSATATKPLTKGGAAVKGIVTDSHQRPLAGATVYLINTSQIDMTPITPADILSGKAEAYDEPLEDIVNNPVTVKTLPKGVTDKNGKFSVKGVDKTARYYAFTVPSAKDPDHIPGGDASRASFSPKTVGILNIRMSWQVPSDSTYIGTTACYVCHAADADADEQSCKHHGHALMFHKMNQDSANQDAADHVGSNWNDFANKFTLATDYKTPVAPATSIETLYFQEYNSTSSNKFVIYENTPGTINPTIYVKAFLWKTAAGVYNITLQNVITPTDPNNFATFVVPMTMGGYIRQRILVKVPNLKGLYKMLSYQSLTGSASQGTQSGYDRSRKPFVEGGSGGGSFTDFFDTTKNLIKFPTSATSNISCAVCHLGGGSYASFTDPATGETLAHTVADPNGVIDLGGDGSAQDVGVNCEQCHGPGSRHREEALKSVQNAGVGKPSVDTTAKFIVNPQMLGADRASLICGRCHDTSGILANSSTNFPPVGISRAQFLANYANPANKGALPSSFWQDGTHQKGGHHGFVYSNWLLSKHSRNEMRMIACDDCHNAMGNSPYRYSLFGDPDVTDGTGLCQQCHSSVVIGDHVLQQTGSVMKSEGMRCPTCHMPRVGKGGAGRVATLIGTPTGAATDVNLEYWENDQSSHVFDVPNKFNAGVAGQLPGNAMPIPYTNSCGTCHDASKLQFQAPQ
ncbi:MAG TPA: cytochrome c3 family protein [Planctomycetota bacterium]|nr:cytochrome c3 family protein [Planctomycetota bacterium]